MSIFDRWFRRDVKNISIAYVDEFLRWTMTNKLGGRGDVWQLFGAVPWLGRGVNLIAQAVHDLPFEIQNAKTGEVVDSSADWKNTLQFTRNLPALLQLVAGSLILRGRAYVYPERNRIAVKALKYLNPDSVEPDLREDVGLAGFIRHAGTIQVPWKPDEVLYFWLLDPQIEIGPPNSYPAQNALNAAGVLLNLDKFFSEHAERGLIKAYLAAVKGLAPVNSEKGKAQKEKLEDDFTNTLTGTRNAGRVKVINADAVTMIEVGEGLKELANVELTKEKREDISVALGIPMSILWSTEASGLGGSGVTKEDTYRFYKQTVVPLFGFIADTANEQLFVPAGYKLVGKPETLDVFQEDERERATALQNLTSAINTDPRTAKLAMEILGYDLDDDQANELEALIADKTAVAERMAQLPASQPPTIDVTPRTPELPSGETDQQKAFREELARWQRKVENRLRSGKALQVDFESDIIPTEIRDRIHAALGQAADLAAVKAVFAEAAKATKQGDGKWITTETGQHIFIPEGENAADVIRERFGDASKPADKRTKGKQAVARTLNKAKVEPHGTSLSLASDQSKVHGYVVMEMPQVPDDLGESDFKDYLTKHYDRFAETSPKAGAVMIENVAAVQIKDFQKGQGYVSAKVEFILETPADELDWAAEDSISAADIGLQGKAIENGEAKPQMGIMIAFAIPESIGQKLLAAVEGKLPEGAELSRLDQLHLTLAFLGRTDEITISRDAILAALKVFAADTRYLIGTIGGIGRMNKIENSGKAALYTLFDSPELPSFREELIETLRAVGAVPSEEHGFVPHITLAYVPADATSIPSEMPGIADVAMTEIVLAWGGNWQPVALAIKAIDQGARPRDTGAPFQEYSVRLAAFRGAADAARQ